MSATYKYAPLDPDGPLPPGVRPEVISRAYRSEGWTPRDVLKALRTRGAGEPAAKALRRVLDAPAARLGLPARESGNLVPPFCRALWNSLKMLQSADVVYSAIVEPAQVEEDDRVFLDPARFASFVTQHREQFRITTEAIAADSSAEALALFALAFGLLQPDDARHILAPVLSLGSAFAAFFGVPEQQAADLSSTGLSGTSEPADLFEGLHTVIELLEQQFQKAADSLEKTVPELRQGRLPRPEAAKLLTTLSETFGTVAQLLIQDGSPVPAEVDLTQLKALAQERVRKNRKAVRVSTHVLERAARIRGVDANADSALENLRNEILRLRAHLESSFDWPEISRLASGEHPVAKVVTLVTELPTLSDSAEVELRQAIASTYGAELARLASRGRFVLSEEAPANLEDPTADHAESNFDDGASPPAEPTIAVENAVECDSPAPEGEGNARPMASSGEPSVSTSAAELDAKPKEFQSDLDAASEAIGAISTAGNATTADAEQFAVIAAAAPVGAADPESDVSQIELAYIRAWEMLAEGRAGLAYQLTLTAEALAPENLASLPSPVVCMAALAPSVDTTLGEVLEQYEAAALQLNEVVATLDRYADSQARAIRMAATAATLRPALLAPGTGAPTLLAALSVEQPLEDLRASISRYAQLGLELTPAILKGVREYAAWSQLLEEHRTRCLEWVGRQRQASIIYAPATDVWRNWLSPEGALARLILGSARDRQQQIQALKDGIRTWSELGFIKDLIQRTDRTIRGRMARLRPIDARATTALVKHAQEGVGLLRKWVALLEGEPDQLSGFEHQQAESCRQQVLAAIGPARRQLQAVARESSPAEVRCAAVIALRLIGDLHALFDSTSAASGGVASVHHTLAADLLAIENLRLDENWRPVDPRTPELLAALIDLTSRPQDWMQVLEARTVEGDHRATERVIQVLEINDPTDERLEELRGRRTRDIARRAGELREDLSRVSGELARAAWYDLIPESEYLALKSSLESLRPDSVLEFNNAAQILTGIRRTIEQYRQQRVEQVRVRLRSQAGELDLASQNRIERALESGDFLVANELIDLAAEGRPLDPEKQEDHFRQYFPRFVKEVIGFLGNRTDARALLNDIRSQRTVGPIDMRRVPGAQAEDAADMLQAWYHAKNRTGRPLRESLVALFQGFGFEGIALHGASGRTADRKWWAELRVTPIADRDVCLIPLFGSAARGTYRVLCTWDRPSEEEIVNAAARTTASAPLLVLYFGQMTEQRRRDLAVLSRMRRRSFLVIDETLVLFLCQVRGARLPVLFQCTLPFTTADPYITTASLVPREMFFGRVKEREALVSPFGPNLVFGGRQLGKTALLRDIERRVHDPQTGSIVRWIDLLSERIGITRPIEDIWRVLANALEEEHVLRSGTRTRESLERQIPEWLSETPTRRILLLLDEADAFLKSDSEHKFENLARLKGLMDRTDRRFKVVLAGLHNVQRTSRDPNTPLGHLGQPVCIGPLLGGEAREAVNLIRLPLEALGYRFDDDLPMAIVSHTNYYPSLLQIYCKHLLEYLSDANRPLFNPRETPPYFITPQHLEAVQNEELRLKILDKFRLTLDLDPRYRVLALLIAWASMDSDRQMLVTGVDPEWVRAEALDLWAAGFSSDTSVEAFRTILDEMIGLGILRKVDDRRYTLRSPNLATLLGSKSEIQDQMLDAIEREAPVPYEASSFRRSEKDDPWIRSPLTAQQEAELLTEANGVAIVFGTALSGNSQVGRFLQLACDGVQFARWDSIVSCGEFLREFDTFARTAPDGLSVVYVPSSVPWADPWVRGALEVLARKTSKRRIIRVVFGADSMQTWLWVQDDIRRRQLLAMGLKELTLKPWSESALRRWLEDTGIAAGEPDARTVIDTGTGSWWQPLQMFAERCHAASHKWRQHLEEVGRAFSNEHASTNIGVFPEVQASLALLGAFDEALDRDELMSLLDSEPGANLERVLRWAELVSYARPQERMKWSIDPFVRKVLAPTF